MALYGAGASETIVCGTGSGYVMAPHTVSVREGLENAGITITSTKWLERYEKASRQANEEDKTLSQIDRAWSGLSILIDDIEVTEEELAEGKEAQTAIYVIRRNAGENHDRRAVKGDYYLSDMELSNIKKVAAAFEHTVIVLNSCVIDANFIEETAGIDGALLLGQAGMEAGNAAEPLIPDNAEVPEVPEDTTPWYLILVNRDNPLPEDFTVETVEFEGGELVDKRIAAALSMMLSDAEADGFYGKVVSGYRTREAQQSEMDARTAAYIAEGFTEEDAADEAKKWVALPGTSEHETAVPPQKLH